MPYWKCFYHIVWATKYRQPIILPVHEQVIFAEIRNKSDELNTNILAINAVSDHVHFAVAIPPALAIAKWVGAVKGASARAVNTSFQRDERFHWQDGYGVMSFGEKVLPQVLEYVANQKTRHAKGDLNPHLERTDED